MRHRTFPACNSRDIARRVDAPEDVALAEIRATEPGGWLASPFDEDGYSAFFGVVPTMPVVLRMAMEVEADPVEAASWYRDTRIAELGDLTAAQLVSLGRTDEVIMFLCAVRDGKRG